ncbi:Phage portal protein [Caballeronia pedi]|uniref:Phage portal protein n=1 Tax=Caballeronia pedi TaxID=1777141 RepID=A0A158E3W6_9BURK|nr:phage portal protein [Caballeronia pedi]SAL01528.1 Phage portal protein [Caballeronia pedi]
MTENAAQIAYSSAAPADERQSAQAEIQKTSLAEASPDKMLPLIEFIRDSYEDMAMSKSLARAPMIPFPSDAVKKKQAGMQSVFLDNMQISVMGDWYEKNSAFSFEAMRAMVDQTPILNSVIMTRISQVRRFCRVQESGKGPGFKIALKDKEAHASDDEKKTMALLEEFFMNSGWETRPRTRMRLKRDDLSSFMSKLVRDTLTLDSMPIETEWKRDKKLGLDGLYAVDGATIRLCTEDGYRGEDEIFALQLVQGNVRSLYTYDDLIYVPRNPRTDVMVGGYGLSETELLVRVVTGFLNAFTYNTKYFDSNQIPKGLLHLTGNYTDQDIAQFKRMWNAMVKGVNNQWALPVMVSKDMESRASFENFGVEVNEMMFGKWMTFLVSIICAIYGIAPDEVNFESFTTGTSSLSGSDTEEKIANSKDKGLRPLLSYFENVFTDFIVQEFSDKYVFRWTGLDDEDPKDVFERQKLTLTWNEMRALDQQDKIEGPLGDAPLNPTLIGPWTQMQQAAGQDFGNPDDAPPGAGGDDKGANKGKGEQDFGAPGAANETGADFGKPPAGDGKGAAAGDEAKGDQAVGDPEQGDDADAMTKSYGLPVFTIEP